MVGTIITIIVVIIIIYIIVRIIRRKSKLVYVTPANYQQVVSASTLGSTTGTTNNCTYSIWIYVNDWSVGYGDKKVIFNRSSGPTGPSDLSLYLGNYETTLFVKTRVLGNKAPHYSNSNEFVCNVTSDSNFNCTQNNTPLAECAQSCDTSDSCIGYQYDSKWDDENGDQYCYFVNTLDPGASPNFIPVSYTGSGSTGFYAAKMSSTMKTCSIPNLEIQKWTNIVLSANTNEMDIYINGKLAQSCNLEGEININNANNVYISPDGGFNGWNSKFQFWPYYMNPHQAMAIYRKGHGGSNTGALSYKLNIALYDGTTEKASVSI